MTVIVAGKDRTAELAADLRNRVAVLARGDDHHRPAELPPGVDALSLAAARTEGEYLTRLAGLLRHRDAVDTREFRSPRRPGVPGWLKRQVRVVIWKAMQFPRERMAFRQNLINTQLTSAIVYETRQRQREIDDLQCRLAELERRLETRAP